MIEDRIVVAGGVVAIVLILTITPPTPLCGSHDA